MEATTQPQCYGCRTRPQEDEAKVLAFLKDHDYVIRSDVDALLGVSQATANRLLKRMVAQALLYQDGSGRNTKYRKNSVNNL